MIVALKRNHAMNLPSLDVLIVEDHPLYMDGLRQIVSGLADAVEIHEAVSGKAALQKVEQFPFLDWIFLDLQLPDFSGVELLTRFKDMMITAPVLVVSSVDDIAVLDRLLSLGASGFLPKSATHEDFRIALSSIESNGLYLPAEQNEQLREYRQVVKNRTQFLRSNLTARQQEILFLMSQGYSNGEISTSLSISESTVKGHVSALFSLFDADNRTHCVAEAHRLGIQEWVNS